MPDGLFNPPWFPLHTDRLFSSRKIRRMGATEFGVFMFLLIDEWKNGPIHHEDDDLQLIGREDPELVMVR